MNRPTRKPLRLTAWALLLSGLGITALMLGTGIYVVAQGQPAGPGHSATWPTNTDIAVMRPLGRQPDNGEYTGPTCTATAPGEPSTTFHPDWQHRVRPLFRVQATLTCEQPVQVLTGSSITTAIIARGPLIAIPAFAAGMGIFLFFPRFTALAASLSHPFGRLVTRITGRDQPK